MSKINQIFFLEADDDKEDIVELLKKLSGSKNKELRKIMLDVFLRDKEYDSNELNEEVLLEICNVFYNIGLDDENLSEIIKTIGYDRDYDYWIEGGKYRPAFAQREKEVADLWIDKFQVTQDKWKEFMDTNPSNFRGPKRPVENVSWLDALDFCNKMSEKYGLQPVYKIENGDLTKIIYSAGEEVYPNLADFTNTEGYRLPTEVEWEWAARGGRAAIAEGTFSFIYSGSNNIGEVAWYTSNSSGQTHDVGEKKENQLGLYDMSGNVWEWCYDTASEGYIYEDKPYIYDGSVGNRRLNIFDESVDSRRLKGGSWNSSAGSGEVVSRCGDHLAYGGDYNCGFRVCRTV